MRVLIVGGGGREHALAWKLAQSSRVGDLLCAPGNAGTVALAETIGIPVSDLDGVVQLAGERRVDLVVIGPEDPLAAGLADRLAAAGIATAGPNAAAARIESSKVWAKDLMREAGVPTGRAVVVRSVVEGRRAIGEFGAPVVVKADGLAAGKGVAVCATIEEAEAVLHVFLDQRVLGDAGATLLIEEHLTGQEVSILALTDGRTTYQLAPACDYKRAFDNDEGPNTGGMGAYTPVPAVDDDLRRTIQQTILEPTVAALDARGAPMRGVLYAGLILTADGPKVLEFNARFGDPETQVVLPTLDGDLGELLHAVAHGRLDQVAAPEANGAAVGVVLASGGYPGAYRTGVPIDGLDSVPADVLVFHAGTARDAAGRIVTAGGRILTVVGCGPDLATAREHAYAGAGAISFPSMHHRHDIARREITV
ncbi:MAG: phosphoribosylamine--glycine ligase [Chloroflexota bacterium]|nr:phosphoribosylamine--glycine ligase [Chloroflexota bacterium]